MWALQKLFTRIGLHPVLLFACQSLSCYGGPCNAVMEWLRIQKAFKYKFTHHMLPKKIIQYVYEMEDTKKESLVE